MKIKTWHFEMLFVGIILSIIALIGGGDWVQWLSAAAVLATFGHVQIANRLEEADEARPEPMVECRHKLNRYLLLKEVLWAISFVAVGAWPALIGCLIFSLYPVWRRFRSAKG